MKAYGPGLQSSGLSVGKPAEFTVDAKLGGKAPLKIQAQVCLCTVLCLRWTRKQCNNESVLSGPRWKPSRCAGEG